MKRVYILLILCLRLCMQADIIDIPKQDLKNIKQLFEDLIDHHDYTYTIFGSKPMSLADFSLEARKDLPFYNYKWIASKLFMIKRRASLDSWYTYRDEFALKDFIFLDEEKDWINCLTLVLINKSNMLRVLHEHQAIFKEELGESFVPESFLEKLEKREVSLTKAINNSQKLMGIMLGYGVRNATIFQERYDLMKAAWRREKENLPEDAVLKQKLDLIESQVDCFSELDADAIIHPLYFLADLSHPETTALQKKYEQERQLIIELRKKRNFMDLVLKRLVVQYSPMGEKT